MKTIESNMINTKRRQYGLWKLLADATGYSRAYCQKVINNDRSQQSKGGKVIVAKYKELQKLLDHESA